MAGSVSKIVLGRAGGKSLDLSDKVHLIEIAAGVGQVGQALLRPSVIGQNGAVEAEDARIRFRRKADIAREQPVEPPVRRS